jgi:hypothetical protein
MTTLRFLTAIVNCYAFDLLSLDRGSDISTSYGRW